MAQVRKIPFLQMLRGVPFKKYRANDLEETCNHPNLWTKAKHISKLNKFWHQLSSFITTLWDGVNYKFIQLVNLKNSCGCIPGYQVRKGLHTGTVKIDPHKLCCNNVFLWDCMGKGAFIKRMDGCSQKLQYTNTIMEKKQTGGRG